MQTENNIIRKSEQREVDLIELMWELLYGWRLIIVLMVIGAVAIGGYKYMNSQSSYESALVSAEKTQEDVETQIESIKSTLSADDLAAANEAVRLYTVIEDQQT
jgi:predicted negative regulator of RcsB-dependent stress response